MRNPTRPPPASAPTSPSISITKIGIPVTVALGVGWAIATLVFGAGGKVSASEKDIAYLAARCDTLSHEMAVGLTENKTMLKDDHDAVIELKVKLTSLKEYIDSVEASKNITISMDDKKDKK